MQLSKIISAAVLICLFAESGLAQTSNQQKCEAEAQRFYSQRAAALEPTPAQVQAAMSQLGGMAGLYGPIRSFQMSWPMQKTQMIKTCLAKLPPATSSAPASRTASDSGRDAQRLYQERLQSQREQRLRDEREDAKRKEDASSSSDRGKGLVADLKALSDLHEDGVLNDQEFNAAKRRLLGL